MTVFSSTGEGSPADPSTSVSTNLSHTPDASGKSLANEVSHLQMSIASRVGWPILPSILWSVAVTLGIGLFISGIYRQSAEHDLQNLLRAELYHVIDSVTIDDQGVLSGNPQLADPRFLQPRTGWYWSVEPRGPYNATPRVSASLGASDLPIVSVREAPFDKNYERFYIVTDAFGNQVQIAETEVVLDRDGRLARFRVAGNMAVVELDVRRFSFNLYLALVVLGIGTLVVHAFARQNRH